MKPNYFFSNSEATLTASQLYKKFLMLLLVMIVGVNGAWGQATISTFSMPTENPTPAWDGTEIGSDAYNLGTYNGVTYYAVGLKDKKDDGSRNFVSRVVDNKKYYKLQDNDIDKAHIKLQFASGTIKAGDILTITCVQVYGTDTGEDIGYEMGGSGTNVIGSSSTSAITLSHTITSNEIITDGENQYIRIGRWDWKQSAYGTITVTRPNYKVTFEGLYGGGSVSAAVDGSSITSGASVPNGTQVTFTATPSGENLRWKWVVNGSADYNNSETRVETVSGDLSVQHEFGSVKVYAYTNDANMGTVNAACGGNSGTYLHLTPYPGDVTFTATPKEGYKFSGWYSDEARNTLVSNDNPYTKKNPEGTYNLYAKFAPVGKTVTLTCDNQTNLTSASWTVEDYSATRYIGATVPVASGKKVYFTATPKDGYLVQWQVKTNGDFTTEGYNKEFTYTMTDADATIKLVVAEGVKLNAKFTSNSAYKTSDAIYFSFAGQNWGQSPLVHYGTDNIILTATDVDGYTFKGWYYDEAGTNLITSEKTYNIPTNISGTNNYYAKYEALDLKNINVNGQNREYFVYAPENISGTVGVVISLHGGGNDYNNGRVDFNGIAESKKNIDNEKFVVVYPRGLFRNIRWEGERGWESYTESNTEDVDFFKAIVNNLNQTFNGQFSIDYNRIYLAGFSNGGMMAYKAAHQAGDFFAAIASVAGFPVNESHLMHAGSMPKPILHIHGTSDEIINPGTYSISTIIDNITFRNGSNVVPSDSNPYTNVQKRVYSKNGNGTAEFIYYTVTGMGHTWWDKWDGTEGDKIAPTMWDFFNSHRLNEGNSRDLKFKLNIPSSNFTPLNHGIYSNNENGIILQYGEGKKTDDNKNVYHSIQLNGGVHHLTLTTNGDGTNSHTNHIKVTLKKFNKTTGEADVTIFSRRYDASIQNIRIEFEAAEGLNEYQLTVSNDGGTSPTISGIEIRSGKTDNPSNPCIPFYHSEKPYYIAAADLKDIDPKTSEEWDNPGIHFTTEGQYLGNIEFRKTDGTTKILVSNSSDCSRSYRYNNKDDRNEIWFQLTNEMLEFMESSDFGGIYFQNYGHTYDLVCIQLDILNPKSNEGWISPTSIILTPRKDQNSNGTIEDSEIVDITKTDGYLELAYASSEQATITATLSPDNARVKDLIWKISNGNVTWIEGTQYSSTLTIQAAKAGYATVTAMAADDHTVVASIVIHVKDADRLVLNPETHANMTSGASEKAIDLRSVVSGEISSSVKHENIGFIATSSYKMSWNNENGICLSSAGPTVWNADNSYPTSNAVAIRIGGTLDVNFWVKNLVDNDSGHENRRYIRVYYSNDQTNGVVPMEDCDWFFNDERVKGAYNELTAGVRLQHLGLDGTCTLFLAYEPTYKYGTGETNQPADDKVWLKQITTIKPNLSVTVGRTDNLFPGVNGIKEDGGHNADPTFGNGNPYVWSMENAGFAEGNTKTNKYDDRIYLNGTKTNNYDLKTHLLVFSGKVTSTDANNFAPVKFVDDGADKFIRLTQKTNWTHNQETVSNGIKVNVSGSGWFTVNARSPKGTNPKLVIRSGTNAAATNQAEFRKFDIDENWAEYTVFIRAMRGSYDDIEKEQTSVWIGYEYDGDVAQPMDVKEMRWLNAPVPDYLFQAFEDPNYQEAQPIYARRNETGYIYDNGYGTLPFNHAEGEKPILYWQVGMSEDTTNPYAISRYWDDGNLQTTKGTISAQQFNFAAKANTNAHTEVAFAKKEFHFEPEKEYIYGSNNTEFDLPISGAFIRICAMKSAYITMYVIPGEDDGTLYVTDETGIPLPYYAQGKDYNNGNQPATDAQKVRGYISWLDGHTTNKNGGCGYDPDRPIQIELAVNPGKEYFIFGKDTPLSLAAMYVKQESFIPNGSDVSLNDNGNSFSINQRANVTLNRTFAANTWASLVLPFSLNEQKFKEVFGDKAKCLHFTDVDTETNTVVLTHHFYNMVVAGRPVFIRPSKEVTNPTFTDVTLQADAVRTTTTAHNFEFFGSYNESPINVNDIYLSTSNSFKYLSVSGKQYPGMRSFIKSPAGYNPKTGTISAGAAKAMFLNFDDTDIEDATGIEELISSEFGENTIIVRKSTKVYDLNGRVVANATDFDNLPSGIYIVNGKKYVK